MGNHFTGNLFFYLGLLFIIVHEMDAVRCREWRIFPGLSLLNDKIGYRLFLVAHLPLFYFLFWGLVVQQENGGLITGLDIFFIVHFGLHLLLLRNKKNEFKDWISWTVISGAGFFGFLDLLFSP